MFGYDINNMLGSLYTNSAVYRPVASVRNTQLSPEFAVMSGLQCLADKVCYLFVAMSHLTHFQIYVKY